MTREGCGTVQGAAWGVQMEVGEIKQRLEAAVTGEAVA